MDRVINYAGAVPLDVDLLNTNKNLMIGLGFALQAILGGSTVVDGLACTPTSPASLQVLVAQGSIYATENVDGTAFGSLGSDTSHQILKQGLTALGNTTFTCAAPSTSGQSIAYLIQGEYQDIDGGSTVLPYYNASNPAVAYNGPANSGTSQNTVRQGKLVLNLKAGASATTGTQVTPTPDAGFTGLWVVTVANGITAITSGMIAKYPGAPFINYKLPQLAPATSGLTELTANTTFHVSTTGSDLTGDGSSGNPWQTIQHAYNFIAANIFIAGFACTIQCADGTYTAGLNATVPTTGGIVTLQGNVSTPANCIISAGASACIAVFDGVNLTCSGGFTITGTSYLVMSRGPSSLSITGPMVYSTGGGALLGQINAFWGGFVEISNNYTISGNAGQHYYASGNGVIRVTSITVTLTGTPTYSGQFALASDNASLELFPITWTGAGSGTAYLATMNGIIDTNNGGTPLLPTGLSAGSNTAGGQVA